MRKSIVFTSIIIAVASNMPPAVAAECAQDVSSASNVVTAIIDCLKELQRENQALREQIATLENTVSPPEQVAQILKESLLGDSTAVATLRGAKGEPGQDGVSPSANSVREAILDDPSILQSLIRQEMNEFVDMSFYGAVVPFDRSEGTSDQVEAGACPEGWSLFRSAGGRMIVGAGTNTNVDQNDVALTDYPSFQDDPNTAVGGEERVELSKEEIPPHTHSGATGDASGQWNTSVAAALGDGYQSRVFSLDTRTEVRRESKDALRHTHSFTTNSGDGLEGGLHNNMPPYIALYFCKKD